MEKMTVCGAGFMGSGIAQVCANAGYEVSLWDLTDELAEMAKANIAAGLERQVERGKMTTQQKDELLLRLIPCSDLSCVEEARFVLEAVLENPGVKQDLFKKVEARCRPDTLLGTNTSYIPITSLAKVLNHPERFLGLHFFAPVYAMKLVEVIRGDRTSEETIQRGLAFVKSIGKESVQVNRDEPGFIVNRLNKALQLEAFRLMHEGIASIEDIDKAAKLGLNHPMGPFELNDMGGLDVTYSCLNLLRELTGDDRFTPIPELEAHVKAGEYGRKTGKGWYDYQQQK